MSNGCLDEHVLVQAHLAGEVSPQMTAHMRACESCRQAVAITLRLRRSLPETLRPDVPPRLLWLRVGLNKRRVRHDTAMLPVRILELAGPVMLIVALLAWFTAAKLNRAPFSVWDALTGETYLIVVGMLIAIVLVAGVGSLRSRRRDKLRTE